MESIVAGISLIRATSTLQIFRQHIYVYKHSSLKKVCVADTMIKHNTYDEDRGLNQSSGPELTVITGTTTDIHYMINAACNELSMKYHAIIKLFSIMIAYDKHQCAIHISCMDCRNPLQ